MISLVASGRTEELGRTTWSQLGRLCDEDSNEDISTNLCDDFFKNVVSICLSNGTASLFSCSGIAIARQGCLTRFLTSASLVRAFDGKTNEYYFDLQIQVCHEGKLYRGFLAEYDLANNFAIVNVRVFLDVNVGIFQRAVESVPCGEACVVCRCVSGELMAKSLELGGDLRASVENDEDLGSETSKAWEGGSVFSVDGEFVGMNLFLVEGRAVFLPWGTIVKHLESYWTFRQKETGLALSESLKAYWFGATVGGKSNSHPEGGRTSNSHPEAHTDLLNQEQLDLDSTGYPKLPPTISRDSVILVNTFEDTFGNIYDKRVRRGVWRELSGKAASSIVRNVVALASFNGEKRFFACTGFFIEWNESTIILTSASLIRSSGDENKIAEGLRIEVLLPDNKSREGTLKHYNLHYNVALVSVKGYHAFRPANTLLSWSRCSEVAAVGRCFKPDTLMATNGRLVSWTGTLDCDFLVRSSCKITKAGIGGPLVTLDGDVLGMNFFDKKIGTPFLLWMDISKILASFQGKSDPSAVAFWKMDRDTTSLNRWPVPMPCWRLRDYVDEDESDDDDVLDPKYGYVNGVKVMLLIDVV
ncbi:unnamed protein product [Urochloa decumbens]|uniref:Uncharacterized protein n=1 Tax=Urochloa decumbens TaxID=240449 RepID=A0ABC9CJJ2_9POAL